MEYKNYRHLSESEKKKILSYLDEDKKPKDKKIVKDVKNIKGIKKEITPYTGIIDDKKVVYYDKENLNKSIFKRAIFITTSLDEDENLSWKLFLESCSSFKPKVEAIGLTVNDLIIENEDTDNITITDGETKIVLNNDMLDDTIIIARGGCINRRGNNEDIVSKLSEKGFLTLNDPKFMGIASNKLATARLFEKYEIPQPAFCKMNKDVYEDEELYNKSINKIYPEWKPNNDKFSDLEFVVKILDGSQGKGVFLCKEKQLHSYFDSIFAIDYDRELIIQKKVEGIDGDLRIHVLNLRRKQIILAAMKRKQISVKDFRSNKSLGAEVLPVKLTPTQEQIALKTASVSGLNWCAVDLMPLKHGSAKGLGDNAVLEINASPGTDGISDAIDENFWNILLSSYLSPSNFSVSQQTVGYFESGKLFDGKIMHDIKLKMDTGNGAKYSSIGCKNYTVNKDKTVSIKFNSFKIDLPLVDIEKVVVGKNIEDRYIVEFPHIKIGNLQIDNWNCGIIKNRIQNSDVLLCRRSMRELNFIVDPSKKFLVTLEVDKQNI